MTMSVLSEILTELFLILGMFFCLASIIGMVRMPDYYCRCHSIGNTETLGLMFPFIGLMIYCGWSLMSLKLLLLFAILFFNNPIGSHTLGRAAYLSNYPVWTKENNNTKEM